MLIWLITTGEVLPNAEDRPHRTGMLSAALAEQGHEVLWWTSTFDHQTKSYIQNKNVKKSLSRGIDLFFLHSNVGYRKNISIQRLINHAGVAKSFNKHAHIEHKPDLIFCSFPTIELSYEAVKYGRKNGIPIILDIRDLWPDIFIQPFPVWLHPIIKLPLQRYINMTRFALGNCQGITAVSEGYLNWSLQYSKRKRSENDMVIPLGYHKTETNSIHRESFLDYLNNKGIDRDKIHVWFVGTFGQTYDLSPVIEAAAKLSKSGRLDIQFIFTGDGEKMQEWTKQANGLKNVVFTGWASKHELAILSEIADIGLMAYKENAPQGLPNKVFEYMSNGIPILSSLQGETKDLLEEHEIGLTYEAGNAKSFLNRMLLLISNKSMPEQMGSNGKRLFNSNFSSALINKKLIEYIETQARKTI